MLTTLLMTIGGVFLLLYAGDALVRGAIALSLKIGLSATLVSVTVVALGTSAPEFVISVEAALNGSPDIALGNVVGSNVANALLIVGVPALLAPLATNAPELKRNYVLMLAATALFTAIALTGSIGRTAGFLLMFSLALALVYLYKTAGSHGSEVLEDGAAHSAVKISILLVAGIVLLPIGAYLLIEGARGLAIFFGLSEAAIGLTVVALGTSLPELAASLAAAMRKRGDVALGNIVGSNMLNLLLVMGATAALSPLEVPKSFQTVDIPIMVGASLLLAPFLIWRHPVSRTAGTAFLLFYGAFVLLALGDVSL